MVENETTCPICGEIIKKGNGHHIKKCIDIYVSNLSEEKIKEITEYYDIGHSMVDMSEFLGFRYSLTDKILKKIGLSRRSVKESKKQKYCKEKYKETCMKHFGTPHNFSKECESRKKWEQKLLEKEGITNVFQRKEVKDKIKKTMLEKYGEKGLFENRRKGNFIEYYIEKYGEEKGVEYFEWVKKRKSEVNTRKYYQEAYGDNWEEIWQQHLKKFRKNKIKNNGLNLKCEKILLEHDIEYEKEYPLCSKDHAYYYDFKVDNLLIELNGIYWHCSPKIYKPNDLVKFPNNKFIRAKDKWDYDTKKCEFAKSKGYQIETIWEDDFNEEILLEIIKKYQNGKSKN